MSVQIDIRYDGGLHCSAIHGPSRKCLDTDAPVDNGGKGEAFSPTDLVATALGSCILTIMGLVAQRSGLDLSGASARVIKEMTAVPTRRIASLKTIITLPNGLNLPPEMRAKLQSAAQTCPVKQSLHPDIEINLEFIYPAGV